MKARARRLETVRYLPLGLAALALVGVPLILLGTRWGPGISDDSFEYLTAAENLAAGRGLDWSGPDGATSPLTHYPPFLSVILAGLIRLGMSSQAAIRALNAALFGVNVALTGVAARRLTGSSALSLLAAALFLLSDVMIRAHAEAMSEGLYLTLSLAGLLLLARSLRTKGGWYLTAAALFIAAASLTRYVGVSLILVGSLALLATPGGPLAKKVRRAAWFLLLTCAPLFVWVGHIYRLTAHLANRSVLWHPVGPGFLVEILDVFLTWFVPGRLVHGRALLVALVVTMVAILVALVLKRRTRSGVPPLDAPPDLTLARLLVGYLMAYLAVFIIAKSTIDNLIFVDNRLLSPMLQVLILLGVFVLRWLSTAGLPRPRLALALPVAALLLLYAGRAYRMASLLYEEGVGYTSRGYHESSTIDLLRVLRDRPIFTNAVPAVYFATGKVPYSITPLDNARERADAECGLLVVFHSMPLDLFGLTPSQVAEGQLLDAHPDAEVYYSASCTTELEPYLGS